MSFDQKVAVYGAYGHTGRFIVAELLRKGLTPILCGRDSEKLNAVSATHGGLEVRVASLDAPASIDEAIRGADAVINSTGPFAVTAAPMLEAVLRAGIPYLDVTAEPDIAILTFEHYAERARHAGIAIVPAVGFYGGLGDLLATAAVDDWSHADEITLAYALSSWKPTLGTRETGRVSANRRGGRRLVFSSGELELSTDTAEIREWRFPDPIGAQSVVAYTTADSVTMSHHLKVSEIHEYMTLAPLRDLADPDVPPPSPAYPSGHSAQTFLIEAVVRLGSAERRAVVSGRDIYAVTAPLVVEAAQRVLCSRGRVSGVLAAGELSDARDFLRALVSEHVQLSLDI